MTRLVITPRVHTTISVAHGQSVRPSGVAAYSEKVRRRNRHPPDQVSAAVAALELPPAVFKTCPWQPQEHIESGLRQWLRCCGPARRDSQVIGMPSRKSTKHGTASSCAPSDTPPSARLCTAVYGRFLHHYPEGGGPVDAAAEPREEQLRRTVIGWSVVAQPDEYRVLFDIDRHPTGDCRPPVRQRTPSGWAFTTRTGSNRDSVRRSRRPASQQDTSVSNQS